MSLGDHEDVINQFHRKFLDIFERYERSEIDQRTFERMLQAEQLRYVAWLQRVYSPSVVNRLPEFTKRE